MSNTNSTGQHSGGDKYHDYIKQIVPVYYKAYPELVPFACGVDRAESIGEESAAACAKRKIAEEKRREKMAGYPRHKYWRAQRMFKQ